MALDLNYSVIKGYLDHVSMQRILNLLDAIGFTLWDEALGERETDGCYAVVKGLQEFREHLGGELHITLLKGVGSAFEVTEMDEDAVAQSIEALARRHARLAPVKSLSSAASAVR
jgi:3-dehydroquinate synthase